jgi:hypothetical protein
MVDRLQQPEIHFFDLIWHDLVPLPQERQVANAFGRSIACSTVFMSMRT